MIKKITQIDGINTKLTLRQTCAGDNIQQKNMSQKTMYETKQNMDTITGDEWV